MLKGPSSEVKAFADHVIAERGVRHGHVVFMPTDEIEALAERTDIHGSRPRRNQRKRHA